ncbi:MAG: hypothetical protein HYW56_01950 [Candidatus Harrisonbacteria bacterium]|nr:hypothetical protein [Candidatus Harrisonbacteria bacterium]
MTEPKRKLVELEKHMPDGDIDGLIYDFGHFLADYIKQEKLVPDGFVLSCSLALHDLQTGVDGWTKKPIRSHLVGYPSITYAVLQLEIPRIAEAIFPPEFAAEVKGCVESINAKAKKVRAAK